MKLFSVKIITLVLSGDMYLYSRHPNSPVATETGKEERKTLKFEAISNYSPVEKKMLNGVWHC